MEQTPRLGSEWAVSGIVNEARAAGAKWMMWETWAGKADRQWEWIISYRKCHWKD